jgi:hypothetical protein
MKEQFDKRLVEKIKDSFEQFQEPLDPIELEKFKKLYLRKKNKGFFSLSGIWWGGIAASIIIGAFIVFQKDEIQNNFIDASQELISSNEKNITSEGLIPSDTAYTSSGSLERSDLEFSGKIQEALDKEAEEMMSSIAINTNIDNVKTLGKNPAEINSKVIDTNAVDIENQVEKNENIFDPFITSNKELTENSTSDESEQEAIDYIQNWLGDEKEIDLNNTLVKIENKKEPVKLGVLVAPQTISNTTQTLNLGAGIMSEFSFSRRIKLDVGLAYARQQIEPSSGGTFNYSSADLSNSNHALSLTEDARSAVLSGNYINASNELSFGQLEIPINLKVKVLENKSSDLYVVSGFSNMLYLNQQNVTTFNAVNIAQSNFSSSNQVVETFTQTQRPDSGSGNVDSGQMLNLGVGFEQSLKNGTFISIEPFYKLSLGTQTFSNQQFSIGGVNLRMNFQIKNKKE